MFLKISSVLNRSYLENDLDPSTSLLLKAGHFFLIYLEQSWLLQHFLFLEAKEMFACLQIYETISLRGQQNSSLIVVAMTFLLIVPVGSWFKGKAPISLQSYHYSGLNLLKNVCFICMHILFNRNQFWIKIEQNFAPKKLFSIFVP